jgi:hypothetical protein
MAVVVTKWMSLAVVGFNEVVLNQSMKVIASFDWSNEANSISQREWLFGCFFVAL